MSKSAFKMKGSAFYGHGNSSPLHKGRLASAWAGTKAGFREFISLGSGAPKFPGEATVDAFRGAYRKERARK